MADMTGITPRTTASGAKRYRAEAWDNATGRRIYKTFPTAIAARNWRRDMEVRIKSGMVRASEPTTIYDAWHQWIAKARAGEIRSRGGSTYKPGVLHSYELSFTGRLLEHFGRTKVNELRRVGVQRYVDTLVAEGLAAQTVRNHVTALRVLMKWCVRTELIAANPCADVALPAGGSTRDRIVPATEAIQILGAIEDVVDRAIYATAFFAGLRRGELMALQADAIDLAARTITVDAKSGSYDPRTSTFGAPKSKKGARTLGIPDLLVPYLAALDATGDDLMFARASGWPFSDSSLYQRCDAGLSLHECRHTYASLMIAAGVNIKTISEWMGHSSVTITIDRYGHLLPGSAKVALGLLNDYLDKELA